MSAREQPRAMYLQGSGAGVFAVLHVAAGPPRPTAVLLCPPFGWEDMCSYRVRREWAERLALDGRTTLRIDLPGSGDSAGSAGDPGLLDAWTLAVGDAAHWLRDDHGCERVAAIGIGLGGLVSCLAVAGGAPIEELVLWSVPARGRALVRELRSFSRLEAANRTGDAERERSGEPLPDGVVFANGYLLDAQTARELERLDLGETDVMARAPARALLLGRDGMKVDAALALSLERAGSTVEIANGAGFAAMMAEPQDARAPTGVFGRVNSWLAQGEPDGHASAAADPPARGPASSRAGSSAREPAEREELVLDCAGVTVRERPLFLDGPGGRLFGVLTEPAEPHAQLTALLLNAGPQRRTGPNRMWVEIARRWAAEHRVATLRLDADGIGDADGDAALLGAVTAFYRPRYVEQALAALETLAQLGLAPRFLTLGLCSGAYWAAQAALADERVAAVIMLNPRTLVFDEWLHAVRRTRYLREQAMVGSTWARLLRGEVKLAKHLETGRTLVGRAASAPLRARTRIAVARHGAVAPSPQAPSREPVEGLFDRLRDRDQRGLLMFTGSEILREELTQAGVLDRMDSWPNLELALLGTSADTHTLTPLWLQRQVHALVDRVLVRELARHGA